MFSISITLSFQGCDINGIAQYEIFWDWFSLSIIIMKFIQFLHVSIICCFLLLCTNPWYRQITVKPSTHWRISELLSVLDYYKLYLYKLLCTFFNIIFISLGTNLLPWTITACLNFKLCAAKSINKNKHFFKIKWSELYLMNLFLFINKQNIPSYWYIN